MNEQKIIYIFLILIFVNLPVHAGFQSDNFVATYGVSASTGNFSGAVVSQSTITAYAVSAASMSIVGQAAGGLVPPGAVFYFAMETPPAGYLECNGSAVSRTTYATLFSAIGITFGTGNGSTTFNLPQLQGEFIRGGHASSTSIDPDGYRVIGSTQTDTFQGHWHTQALQITNNSGGTGYDHGSTNFTATTSSDINITSPVTDGTNGVPRTSKETRPRNVALLPCIKY